MGYPEELEYHMWEEEEEAWSAQLSSNAARLVRTRML